MVPEEKSGVEKLKRALYARTEDIRPPTEERTPLTPSDAQAPHSWESTHVSVPVIPVMPEAVAPSPQAQDIPQFKQPKRHMSLATKFLLGSIAFSTAAFAFAAFMVLGGVNTISPQNIDIEIVAPSLIDGGKEATFQFIITNRNQADLELADLILVYPEGTRSAKDPAQSLTRDRLPIGTIQSGEQIKRTASALIYGQEGVAQNLRATLEYSVVGSNAVFQKQAETSYTVGSSPVSITIEAPTEAISNEQFTMKIAVRSNATTPVDNVVVQGQYPFGFSVLKSEPQADAGGTFWRLGSLKPGSTKTITIYGAIDGQDGDARVFRFSAGSNADQTDTKIKVPFLVMPQTITIHQPFISGSIAIAGQSGKVVSAEAGKLLQGSVQWQNNLSEPVTNVELVLSLSGPALNKSNISASSGFYQSSDTTIIWSKDQNDVLASVPPGKTGSFQFSFATLPPGSSGVLVTNPIINLNLVVRGTRQNSGSVPELVSSAATAQVQLSSLASLTTNTLHSTGGFTNIGPMPPKAEAATSYTVVWKVKNSSNTVANSVVTAVLPQYVQFLSTPSGSGITYDAPSRTVRWTIGDIKAGVGYTLTELQAAFQVTLIPSTSQVGTSPVLVTAPVLTGQDRFTQAQVRTTGEAATTKLVGESSPINGVDIVMPKQ